MPNIHRAGAVAISAVAAAVITMPAARASDGPGEPVGDPYYVYLTSNEQKSIIAGETSAAIGAVCVTTRGAGCTASGLLAPLIAPYVADDQLCPNGGTRKLRIQNLAPFNPASENPFVPEIEDGHCIPAGTR